MDNDDPLKIPKDLAEHVIFAEEYRRSAKVANITIAPIFYVSAILGGFMIADPAWGHTRNWFSRLLNCWPFLVVSLTTLTPLPVIAGVYVWWRVRWASRKKRYADWAALPGASIPFYPRYIRSVAAPFWMSASEACFCAVWGLGFFFLLAVFITTERSLASHPFLISLLGTVSIVVASAIGLVALHIIILLLLQALIKSAISVASGIEFSAEELFAEELSSEALASGKYEWELWPGDS